MEVKEGYKRTEVGVIPEDWENFEARAIGSFRGGSAFPIAAQGCSDGDYPFFKVSDLNHPCNKIRMTEAKNWISSSMRKRLGASAFPTGAIIFAKVGAAIYLERKRILSRPSCLDNNMAAFVVDDAIADVRFIYFLLLETRLAEVSVASALPSLNGRSLGSLEFSIPPLPEQKAIAEALSDVDDLIASLERLIAKKRDIKTATMGQLLTGRTRLPGFTGEWERKRLGELGAFFKGRGVKKDETRSGELPCIRYGEIYTHHHDYIRSFNSWISRAVAKAATPLREGDLLFAGSGETKAEIGKCVAFLHDCEAYAGGDIVILRAIGVDSRFLGYQLNTSEIAAQKASYGQGDAVVHISAGSLAAIGTLVPRLAEQTAIAAVLSDMDAEIEALESRLAKTRMLKQGMMQELLTGRTRLV